MRPRSALGVEWAEVFENEMLKYQTPVVIVHDGERELPHMGWGMPAPVLPLRHLRLSRPLTSI